MFLAALLLGLSVAMPGCIGRTGTNGREAPGFSAADSVAEVAELPAPKGIPDSADVARSETERRLEALGLVDVAVLDTTIAVHLVYATPDNFMGRVLYHDLQRAYLHPDAAAKLLKAQRLLKALHPELSLTVCDAARPMSVQRAMWDQVKGTSRNIYVSNPARGGGLHNYGLAVDVTLVDADGTPLPMGTPVDWLGPEAHTDREAQLVAGGVITEEERGNRLLLRRVMREAGFRVLPSEWWHFNAVSRTEARERYPVIE